MESAKSLVITILRLLTTNDLTRLTQTLRSARQAAKKAAGAEVLVWADDDEGAPVSAPEAKVIAFPSKDVPAERASGGGLEQLGVLSAKEQVARQKAAQEEEDRDKPSETDFLLEEREKFKESEDKIFKQNGFACYQQSSNLSLYRVTVTDDKGKEKTKLTSTQGVLVNRKQA